MRKSTFYELFNKYSNDLMEADTNYSVLLLDCKRETSKCCFSCTCLGELGDWMTAEKQLSCQLTVEISWEIAQRTRV